MKIKKIQLLNWQKHENLILDFQTDLNIISGYSNVGKSSIRRAISWVCFNENISENDYRKEGTKETSVKIYLDSDFIIERIRSNSLNRYILSKEGCEDKIFDSFGRDIPEQIKDVLKISEIEIENEKLNLNIAEQLTLPFLLDKSATFRAKLFNKLTGNELLDKLFKELNKENLRFNKEIKETEENVNKQEEQLKEYSLLYKNLKNKLSIIKDQYDKLQEEIKIYEYLKELSSKLKTNKENNEFVQFKISQIKVVSLDKLKELKTQAERIKKIQEISYELEAINESLAIINKQKNNIKVVKIDEKQLISSNDLLQKLIKINEKLEENLEKQQTIMLDQKVIKENLEKNQKELDKVWEENPICPLCGKEK